eukprot:scaffold38952_cov61-Phaeocystis_antarctica.AAC.3
MPGNLITTSMPPSRTAFSSSAPWRMRYGWGNSTTSPPLRLLVHAAARALATSASAPARSAGPPSPWNLRRANSSIASGWPLCHSNYSHSNYSHSKYSTASGWPLCIAMDASSVCVVHHRPDMHTRACACTHVHAHAHMHVHVYVHAAVVGGTCPLPCQSARAPRASAVRRGTPSQRCSGFWARRAGRLSRLAWCRRCRMAARAATRARRARCRCDPRRRTRHLRRSRAPSAPAPTPTPGRHAPTGAWSAPAA